MSYKVDNAVILAAGMSSRFAPLSFEKPKALIPVKGEVLIERQIRQLKEAGVEKIVIVTGYKKEQFAYLKERYGVTLVENREYATRNNNGSIYAARPYIRNSYICCADNYFSINPFETEVEESYYAGLFSEGRTAEWCMSEGPDGYIDKVTIGGENSWYMLGHVFWSEEFSRNFLKILSEIYDLPQTRNLLWEGIYKEHLDLLKMKIRRYESSDIFEFDSLGELRAFDYSYINDSKSEILRRICERLGCQEKELYDIEPIKEVNSAVGITFKYGSELYRYEYLTENMERM